MGHFDTFFIDEFLVGMSFSRFLLKEAGDFLPSGAVLVAEDQLIAQKLEFQLIKCYDAVKIRRLNRLEEEILNYQIGVHIYRKNEEDTAVQEYMGTDDFLPVLIVVGIVPSFLENLAYVFFIKEPIMLNRKEMFEGYKNWVINHIERIEELMKEVSTSRYLKKTGMSIDLLYEAGIASGLIWSSYKRYSGMTDEETDYWMTGYSEWLLSNLKNAERLMGIYHITEAFRYLFYCYIEQMDCKFIDTDEEIATFNGDVIMEENVIYYTKEHYFFSEDLLREISAPMCRGITFHQFRLELEAEGTLVPNNTANNNKTVKKVVPTFDINKPFVQRRFYRLIKEPFLSDDDLYPEKYVELFSTATYEEEIIV